jgi:uncharacterized protein (DUF58 family)
MRQRDAITLWAVVDVSASMAASPAAWEGLRSMVASVALSAVRNGDQFGLVAADDHLRDDIYMPSTRRRGAAHDAFTLLAPHVVRPGAVAHALPRAADRMSGRRGLVFLISDFYLPIAEIERTFVALSVHDVVPVMIHHAVHTTIETNPNGWTVYTDAETGQRRSVLMRPRLEARLRDAQAAHHAQVQGLARQHARPLVEIRSIEQGFDVDAMTRYFLSA